MSRSVASPVARVHRLKVVLCDTEPPVWRRILVRSNTTLADLHHILQRVMGWDDCHLHQFRVGNAAYGPAGLADMSPRQKDEARARLASVAPTGSGFVYEYDFGDGWEHLIDVEGVIAADNGEIYPRCLAGERACPPEDCGGAWGYAEMLDTLASDSTVARVEWLGDEFDPDHFDPVAVNAMLSPGPRRVALSQPIR